MVTENPARTPARSRTVTVLETENQHDNQQNHQHAPSTTSTEPSTETQHARPLKEGGVRGSTGFPNEDQQEGREMTTPTTPSDAQTLAHTHLRTARDLLTLTSGGKLEDPVRDHALIAIAAALVHLADTAGGPR